MDVVKDLRIRYKSIPLWGYGRVRRCGILRIARRCRKNIDRMQIQDENAMGRRKEVIGTINGDTSERG